MSVIIETSIGDFTVDLFTDERPRCCLNFLKLCKMKYYNFSLFHTVQQNLVAQCGDPTASGRGGQSIFAHLYGDQARFFDMEVVPRIKHTKKGLVSMVNNGGGMHGSQFFITLASSLDYLDGKHTVFGEVAEGMDVIERLNNAFCDEKNRPHQDIRIYHTIILDDPYDDPDNLHVPACSPGPTREMLESDRIPCDADVNQDEGKTEEELAELAAHREAQANSQLLEMVGDLPTADLAPPENVLFVCKLNPVTTSEDLETIFSRFGPVVSCEVIKDSKTGDSLQYAFVEFENAEHCENAYFKMDNVLIDDRRVHVDFSQSVAKYKWKGKGRGVEIINDGEAPIYVLKNQERRNDGYNLVLAEGEEDHSSRGQSSSKKTSKREKKKKKRKKSSSDEEEREKTRSELGLSRSRSRGKRQVDEGRGQRDRSKERDNRKMRKRSGERDVRWDYSGTGRHREKEEERRDRRTSDRGGDRPTWERRPERQRPGGSRQAPSYRVDGPSEMDRARRRGGSCDSQRAVARKKRKQKSKKYDLDSDSDADRWKTSKS